MEGIYLYESQDTLLSFSGPDVKKFLQGVTTNDIRRLQPEKGLGTFFLNEKGKWVARVRLFEHGDQIWGITSDLEAKHLSQSLQTLLLFSQTSLEKLHSHSLFYLIGKELFPYLEKIFSVSPAFSTFDHFQGSLQNLAWDVLTDLDGALPTALVIVSKAQKTELVQLLSSAISLDEKGFEQFRILSAIPRFGVDVDEKTLPPEAGFESYINYTKGCYRGQETISRIEHYGRVNRRLCRIKIDASDLPLRGSSIFKGEKEVGKITSIAFFSPGEAIGLGMVHSEAALPGTKISLSTPDGEQSFGEIVE